MAQPRLPIETIRYKTYIKQTLVNALRSMFTAHPDQILSGTKSTIDFPNTQADYPAVVVRFYERTIKNAGLGHEEQFSTGEVVDQETWFDPFAPLPHGGYLRNDQDYKVTGTYPTSGTLTTSSFRAIPWKPSQAIDTVTGQRVHARINRTGSEVCTVRVGLAASIENSVAFVGEVVFGASNVVLNVIYINAGGTETVVGTSTIAATSGTRWATFHLEGDGTLRLDLMDGDPLVSASNSLGSASATATSPQLAAITPSNTRYSIGGVSATNGSSKIALFRTLKTNVEDQRMHKFNHYFYDGDIEFAIYALSSYDRDLISDTLIQTLAMGKISEWPAGFTDTIANPNTNPAIPATIDHTFTLNTDTIQGMGESQQAAPWQPEDVLVYQTGYRVGVTGSFYSPTPEVGSGIGLVERIETYPYSDGEAAPNPPFSGPDHIQGTADDIVVADSWD